jgi:hypothetical protein
VCSHGHFDHTTGLDGLIRAIGPLNMPVLIDGGWQPDPMVLDDQALIISWRAQHAMSARFPEAFIPNAVGTSFHL